MDNNINQAYRDLLTQMVEIRHFIRAINYSHVNAIGIND